MRLECIPSDDNVFNHSIDNWKVVVNQDFRPDWFDLDEVEAKIKTMMQEEIFPKQFAVDLQDWTEYKNTKIYVKNSKIKVENSSVEARGNSSVVIPNCGCGKCNKPVIKGVYDLATVKDIHDNSTKKIYVATDFEIEKFAQKSE